jgi:hypothetical protein
MEINLVSILESTPYDKNLYPDYKFNIREFSEIYRILSLSRNLENLSKIYYEDWNNYNEVIEWTPDNYKDLLSYNSILKTYIKKEF